MRENTRDVDRDFDMAKGKIYPAGWYPAGGRFGQQL